MTTSKDATDGATARPSMAVLGAGSWGTALAIQFARTGNPTRTVGPRRRAAGGDAHAARCNTRYLPTRRFPTACSKSHLAAMRARRRPMTAGRRAEPRLSRVADAARAAAATPACASPGPPRASSSTPGMLPHQVAHEVLGPGVPMAVLSGPTFAREVGRRPAHRDDGRRRATRTSRMRLRAASSGQNFRTYVSTDIIGVEIGGAMKNVIADRRGHFRRPGLRRQHARRADHARPERDDAARRGARRARRTPSWASRAWATWC